MGAVEATVKIVTSAMWPAVALVAVVLFRRNIASIIERLSHRVRRLKAPGVDVEFAVKAEVAAGLAEVALPSPPTRIDLPLGGSPAETAPRRPVDLNNLLWLAYRDPNAAVYEAWDAVVAAKRVTGAPRSYSVVQAVTQLRDAGKLSNEMAKVATTLSTLRDQIDLTGGLGVADRETARDFAQAAYRLVSAVIAAPPHDFTAASPAPKPRVSASPDDQPDGARS